MDILQAARQLRPGTAWTLITDFNPDRSVKSQQLVQAEDGSPRVKVPTMAELQPVMDSDTYAVQRAAAYPSIGDQLDALWKGGADAQAMGDQIRAIKAKYPKPG